MTATAAKSEARPAGQRTATGSLDSLTIRRRTTGEQAASRAMLMRRLRVILPVVALLLIAAFFFNTRSNESDDAFLNDFADLEATPQSLRTSNPRFAGVDAKGNPYDITAETATQRPGDDKVVELDRPRAVTSGADKQSVVAAEAGIFDSSTKMLELGDGVTFEHALGRENYVLKTPAATVSIDDQTVVSDKGVVGDGPGGSMLKADRMNAYNREGRVVFEGNVSMRLYPKSAGADDAGSGPAQQPDSGDASEGNEL